MQLFALLAALVAVNVGIVYVGSEIYEEGQQDPQQGIVEIEEVPTEPVGPAENGAAEAVVPANESTPE